MTGFGHLRDRLLVLRARTIAEVESALLAYRQVTEEFEEFEQLLEAGDVLLKAKAIQDQHMKIVELETLKADIEIMEQVARRGGEILKEFEQVVVSALQIFGGRADFFIVRREFA